VVGFNELVAGGVEGCFGACNPFFACAADTGQVIGVGGGEVLELVDASSLLLDGAIEGGEGLPEESVAGRAAWR
jgi:hypothetical protein